MLEVENGIYQTNPNQKPLQLSEQYGLVINNYGTILIADNKNYTFIIYINVFGSIAAWANEVKKWRIVANDA